MINADPSEGSGTGRASPQAGQNRPAQKIPPDLRLAAAQRLVPRGTTNRLEAARRLLAGSEAAGISLEHMYGVIHPASRGRPAWVSEVALAVPGAGRTAMVFLGAPATPGTSHEPSGLAAADRLACLKALEQGIANDRTASAPCVLQALPEPQESWIVDTLTDAGFCHVGDLAYLKRPLRASDRSLGTGRALPPGVTTRQVTALGPGSPDHEQLIRALNASYEQTLDCPELCGMRETTDVIESHLATGRFDPSLWTIVLMQGEPVGCALFNEVPDNRSAELVYLGVGPAARGLGLGRWLVEDGLARVARQTRATEVLCAVDRRNAPAFRVYKSIGFGAFASRTALVKAVRRADAPPPGA